MGKVIGEVARVWIVSQELKTDLLPRLQTGPGLAAGSAHPGPVIPINIVTWKLKDGDFKADAPETYIVQKLLRAPAKGPGGVGTGTLETQPWRWKLTSAFPFPVSPGFLSLKPLTFLPEGFS